MSDVTVDRDIEQEGEGHEASASAEAFIEARTHVAPGETEPETLYHYTSAQGLIDILRDGAVWATSIRHLNDASEYVHTLRLMEESSVNALARHFSLDRYLIESVADSRYVAGDAIGGAPCYVASFSANGNLLSQWRAYCPSGNGYSIGISRNRLEAHVAEMRIAEKPWRLVRCEYSLEAQGRVLRELLEEAHRTFDQLNEEEQVECDVFIDHTGRWQGALTIAGEPPNLSRIRQAYADGITRVAPTFKDPAFKEEAEWRVVSPLVFPGTSENYRAGRYSVIPYLSVGLPREDGQVCLEKIFVGPTENAGLAVGTVRRLCLSFGIRVVDDVEPSGVPFRHWDSK